MPIGRMMKAVTELAVREGVHAGMVERVGKGDPYKILVSCILSLRTKDELTEKKSRELWRHASTPREMTALGHEKLARLIYPVGFYRRKSRQIVDISRILLREHGGSVPDSIDELVRLPGVGRKTANLVVSVGFGKPAVCVDTHVHRIVNRWGYVETGTPNETETALRAKLPRRYWMTVNALLVFFGKTVCTPVSPRCSTCPLRGACPAVGVGKSR